MRRERTIEGLALLLDDVAEVESSSDATEAYRTVASMLRDLAVAKRVEWEAQLDRQRSRMPEPSHPDYDDELIACVLLETNWILINKRIIGEP